MTETEILAHIIMGESGTCGLMALIATAYLYQRNPTMYGWQTPSALAVWVALLYEMYPDPTPTAHYLFSREDTQRPAVRRLIGHDPPLAVFVCGGGLRLYAY